MNISTSYIAKLFVLLLLLLNQVAFADKSTGGSPIDYTKDPYVATITWPGWIYSSSCLGTFIKPNVVITAGHCVYDKKGKHIASPTSLKISIRGNKNLVKVNKVIVNPEYLKSNNYLFDSAILILNKNHDIDLVEYDFDGYKYLYSQLQHELIVKYFGLDYAFIVPMTGDMLVTTGDKCASIVNDILKNEPMLETEKNTLENAYSVLTEFPTGQFCGINYRHDNIQGGKGDSGGGLFLRTNKQTNKQMLSGILSRNGELSKSRNYNSIFFFTNIIVYEDFINSCASGKGANVKGNSPGDQCNVSKTIDATAIRYLLLN